MIKVKYECEETGQSVIATVKDNGDGTAELTFTFSPEVSDETQDPFGIMGNLLHALSGTFNAGANGGDEGGAS